VRARRSATRAPRSASSVATALERRSAAPPRGARRVPKTRIDRVVRQCLERRPHWRRPSLGDCIGKAGASRSRESWSAATAGVTTWPRASSSSVMVDAGSASAEGMGQQRGGRNSDQKVAPYSGDRDRARPNGSVPFCSWLRARRWRRLQLYLNRFDAGMRRRHRLRRSLRRSPLASSQTPPAQRRRP